MFGRKKSFLPIQGLVHFDFYNRREECSQRLDVRGPGVEPGIFFLVLGSLVVNPLFLNPGKIYIFGIESTTEFSPLGSEFCQR